MIAFPNQLFGFGMMTSTATYPVEITQTVPGTGIPTTPPVTITTGSAVSGLSYPGVTGTATGKYLLSFVRTESI